MKAISDTQLARCASYLREPFYVALHADCMNSAFGDGFSSFFNQYLANYSLTTIIGYWYDFHLALSEIDGYINSVKQELNALNNVIPLFNDKENFPHMSQVMPRSTFQRMATLAKNLEEKLTALMQTRQEYVDSLSI